MKTPLKKVDAVFEGGGVKGIGLVGAIKATEEQGYTFENVAGTSAGAIIAALVAAKYSASEMKSILDQLDYRQFKDEATMDKIPLIGHAVSLGIEKGIFEGKFFENWLRELLAAKNIHTFGDLVMPKYKDDPRYRYGLRVVATDCTHGRMLVLPQDIEGYGIHADDLSVVDAVRMSMSIPFFFEPVILKNISTHESSYIVDGGVLSNYPVYLFDDGTPNPPWPTIGYKLVDPDENKPHCIRGPLSLFAALFSTMMEAHDARYIKERDFARTVPVPTCGVGTTEFDLSCEKSEQLYTTGYQAAKEFFDHWRFESWIKSYRQKKPLHRTERIRN